MIGNNFVPLLLMLGVLAMTNGQAADTSAPTKVDGKPKKTSSGLEYWEIQAGTGDTAKSGKPVTVWTPGSG